jgi:hypothetical protein
MEKIAALKKMVAIHRPPAPGTFRQDWETTAPRATPCLPPRAVLVPGAANQPTNFAYDRCVVAAEAENYLPRR